MENLVRHFTQLNDYRLPTTKNIFHDINLVDQSGNIRPRRMIINIFTLSVFTLVIDCGKL